MARRRALFALVSALAVVGTAGCPQLAEDDFVVVPPDARATAGTGGKAGARGGSAGGGSAGTSTGGQEQAGMGGVGDAPGGATGLPLGGAAGFAAEGGAPSSGAGDCENERLDPGESDTDCGGVCAACVDGEICRSDSDCASGRCSTAGICRACGLRLMSVQNVCPASCTRCVAGVCYIDCDNAGACKQASVVCPSDLACQVVCTGVNACEETSVECPDEFPCDVACTGKQSCREMTVSCGSGPCGLECSAESACEATSLRCGSDHCETKCGTGAVAPSVACAESCGCQACSG
jgi:hypothetical protein